MRITFAVGRIVAGTSHIIVSRRERVVQKVRHRAPATAQQPATVH